MPRMRFMRFVRECCLEGYVTSHEADPNPYPQPQP